MDEYRGIDPNKIKDRADSIRRRDVAGYAELRVFTLVDANTIYVVFLILCFPFSIVYVD